MPTRRLTLVADAAIVAFVAAVAFVGIVAVGVMVAARADAHAELDPAQAATGTVVDLVLHLENERSDAGTTRVELALPVTLSVDVDVPEVPGWTVSQLAATDTTGPRVVWTGGPATDAIELPLTVGPLPNVPGRLQFKVLQTYEDGQIVRWIDAWPPGAPEPAHPGPVLDLEGSGSGGTLATGSGSPDVTAATGAGASPGATTASPAGGAASPAATTRASAATSAPTGTTGSSAPSGSTAVAGPTVTAVLTTAAATSDTGATGDAAASPADDGSNTLAFVALGAALLAVAALILWSARRRSF